MDRMYYLLSRAVGLVFGADFTSRWRGSRPHSSL